MDSFPSWRVWCLYTIHPGQIWFSMECPICAWSIQVTVSVSCCEDWRFFHWTSNHQRYGLRWFEEEFDYWYWWFTLWKPSQCFFTSRISLGWASPLCCQKIIAPSCLGSPQHGVGDFRIPIVARSDLSGHRINISSTYPYRGISRSNSCTLQPPWGMHICENSIDYRMLIIESMDADTERRRLSPVAIMSDSGYIDLINGPQDHGICNGYACRRRISTFMGIVQSLQTYQIYFSSTPPRQTRFRLINANSNIKCILALRYDSLQQIDVYANALYIPPTNRDLSSSAFILRDLPNGVTLSASLGANYFDRFN